MRFIICVAFLQTMSESTSNKVLFYIIVLTFSFRYQVPNVPTELFSKQSSEYCFD